MTALEIDSHGYNPKRAEVIPAELRALKQWITWGRTQDGGKRPDSPTDKPAKFLEFMRLKTVHIGFVFQADDPYCGIDLDDCRDMDSGAFTPWATEIMDRFKGVAYCEISPSGTGVKLTTRAKKPRKECTVKIKDDAGKPIDKQKIECFDFNRFWAMTGNVVEGFEAIGDGQPAVDWLYDKYYPAKKAVAAVAAVPSKKKRKRTGIERVTLNDRVRMYVDAVPGAIAGQAGHPQAFKLAIKLVRGFCLDNDEALKWMQVYNQRCLPPWSDEEISHKIDEARRVGDMEFGFLLDGQRNRQAEPIDTESVDDSQSPTMHEQSVTPEYRSEKPPPVELVPIASYGHMVRTFTQLRPERIQGLLRDTELLNIIAAPKIGKSYLVGGMAIAIATGRTWMGRDTRQGRVLMIDNELHPELTTDRLSRICRAMEIDDHEIDETIDVLSLRGHSVDINWMGHYMTMIERGHYGLIVLDALYRTLPEGSSENDNAAMTAIFNRIDRYAEMTGSAFAIVHHSSKGDQSGKSITDMGSGAGSISRATDTHLVIRPHESDGLAVLEAVTRSFAQPDATSIKWEYPQWVPVAVPANVKQAKSGRESSQDTTDIESDSEVLAVILADLDRTWTTSQIRRRLGYGESRAGRAVQRLLAGKKIFSRSENRRGQTTDVFSATAEIKDGTADGTA